MLRKQNKQNRQGLFTQRYVDGRVDELITGGFLSVNFMVEERISNECKNKIHSLPFCISSIGDLHDIVIQFFSQPIKSLVCG